MDITTNTFIELRVIMISLCFVFEGFASQEAAEHQTWAKEERRNWKEKQ